MANKWGCLWRLINNRPLSKSYVGEEIAKYADVYFSLSLCPCLVLRRVSLTYTDCDARRESIKRVYTRVLTLEESVSR